MERGWFVFSLLVGLIVWILGDSLPVKRLSRPPWFAAVPALLGFLLCLPVNHGWASGLDLGIGLLVGGVGAALALSSGRGPIGVPPALAAGLVLLHRPFVETTLLGAALGWLATVVTATLCNVTLSHPATRSTFLMVLLGLGGVLGDSKAIALFVTFSAVLVALPLVPKLVSERWGVALLVLVGALVLRLLVTVFVGPKLALVFLGVGGLFLTLFVAQLVGDGADRAKSLLGAALVVCAVLLAAHFEGGVGVALLGLSLAVLPVKIEGSWLALATLLVAQRVFERHWGQDRSIVLTDNAAMLGLFLGGALPLAAAALNERRAGLAAVLSTAVVILGPPVVVTLLYGGRCALSVVLGALFVAVFDRSRLAGILAVALTLFLDRAMVVLTPQIDLTRYDRLRDCAIVFGISALLLGMSALLGRKKARR